MAVWDIAARLWTIARQFEELLKLQAQTRTALEAIEDRLRALEDRMTRLEAGQGQLITEAKAAAGIAATGLAGCDF
jgi:BMFP domain-containing protein YqiC